MAFGGSVFHISCGTCSPRLGISTATTSMLYFMPSRARCSGRIKSHRRPPGPPRSVAMPTIARGTVSPSRRGYGSHFRGSITAQPLSDPRFNPGWPRGSAHTPYTWCSFNMRGPPRQPACRPSHVTSITCEPSSGGGKNSTNPKPRRRAWADVLTVALLFFVFDMDQYHLKREPPPAAADALEACSPKLVALRET